MELAERLAHNLIALRRQKRYSQQALAQRAAVPRSTLAHMESGSGNPSLTNLAAIAAALTVSLEELLARPRSNCSLVPRERIPVKLSAGGDIQVHELLPERVKGLEIIRMELAAGATRVGSPHLAGTKEYLYGLDGTTSVLVAGELYPVHAGDVLAFPGDQPHSYSNRERAAATALSIVVPLPASAG